MSVFHLVYKGRDKKNVIYITCHTFSCTEKWRKESIWFQATYDNNQLDCWSKTPERLNNNDSGRSEVWKRYVSDLYQNAMISAWIHDVPKITIQMCFLSVESISTH